MDFIVIGKNRIITAVVAVCIIIVIVISVNMGINLMNEYGKITTKNQSTLIARELEHRASEALNSIEMVANEFSANMDENGKLTKNPNYIIQKILEKTPFDFIEYVDELGRNYLEGESTFDASDRPYYVDGMDGNSGVWVNYEPERADEVLLDFYAPVRFGNSVKCVLVGAIRADSSVSPVLNTGFFGTETIGILTDGVNNLITSTFPDHEGLDKNGIFSYFKLSKSSRDIFDWHLENEISDPFVFQGDRGTAIGSIEFVNNTGWKVFIIIPSASIAAVSADFARIILVALAVILVLICIYIIYIVGVSRAALARENTQRKGIIEGFSKAYYSVFFVNLDENTGECFRTSDIMSANYGIKPHEPLSYSDTVAKYIFDSADQSEKYKLSFLINKRVIKGTLKESGFFSVLYLNKSGEKTLISVALADEKNGQNGILIGLSSVNEFVEETKA